jgi:hypothetical protein
VNGKLVVRIPESKVKVYGRWFKMDGILSMTDDSLFLNNVRLHIMKSTDSIYHVSAYKYSNGYDEAKAVNNVNGIRYGITQQDSSIYLDKGIALLRGTKFRNQSVTVTIQVPVGKKIVITRSVSKQLNNSFRFNTGHNDWDFDEEWSNKYEDWDSDVEYIMTVAGLERVDKKDKIKEEEFSGDSENDASTTIQEKQRRITERSR